MKSRAALAALAAVPLAVAFLWVAGRSPGGPVSAPSFVLPDLEGKVVRIADFRGKVVLLNLWTTWCPPCIEEMPTLEGLSRKMTGRDFVVVAVSQDELPQKVKPWVEERGLTFPVLLDPRGEVGSAYGVTGYPETFVIDRQGTIVHHRIGPMPKDPGPFIDSLEGLLKTGEWQSPPRATSG